MHDMLSIPLCNSSDLVNSGLAVPFDVVYCGQTCTAFAIRYQGTAHAYLNRCSHVAMEVDYLPGMESWIEGLQKRADWDYFIGSVHYLDETWDIDNPNKMEFWKAADPDEVWTKYFERLAQAAATGYFHIMGHMDLPKKFSFYPKGNLDPVVSKFLETVKAHDVAIELNTAGLRKDCREIYPSRHYLEMAHEIGVAITFGSDAHAPEEVGADFDQAIEMAKSVGYRSTRVFTQRSYELVEI